MEESNKLREETLEHIDRQVTRMDGIITKLLRDINIEGLDTSERLNLFIRCIGQQNRTLELRLACTDSENGDSKTFVSFMHGAGELPTSVQVRVEE